MEGRGIGSKLLHFAPESAFFDIFSKNKEIDYYPVDLDPKRYGKKVRNAVDVTNIPYEENYFDTIICLHLLEHVADDIKAISELHRVLKKGGDLFIMIPQKDMDKTFENPEYNTDELRRIHFGQHDHVRWYGLDFVEKLQDFECKVILPEEFLTKEQIAENSVGRGRIYHCIKI